jgi:hypothetical protein
MAESFCDRCDCSLEEKTSYHIGTYEEEVEKDYRQFYCYACFVEVAHAYLRLPL